MIPGNHIQVEFLEATTKFSARTERNTLLEITRLDHSTNFDFHRLWSC